MPKTAKLKNTSKRPITLHDGTLLVPNEETEVAEETVKQMKEHMVAKTGQSSWDHLKEHHGLEEVEGVKERPYPHQTKDTAPWPGHSPLPAGPVAKGDEAEAAKLQDSKAALTESKPGHHQGKGK